MSTSPLSRELLKWLQSLDLTLQIKNPRRDLSNGYAVAEILSCYFPTEVETFSYENATGLARKVANWELLYKFVKKKGIPVSRELISDTMHAKPDAAVTLLETVYTFLTNKTPSKTAKASSTTLPPLVPEAGAGGGLGSYAKPTASRMVKDALQERDNVVVNDALKAQLVAQNTLDERAQAVRADKVKPPLNTLYGPKPSPAAPAAAGGVGGKQQLGKKSYAHPKDGITKQGGAVLASPSQTQKCGDALDPLASPTLALSPGPGEGSQFVVHSAMAGGSRLAQMLHDPFPAFASSVDERLSSCLASVVASPRWSSMSSLLGVVAPPSFSKLCSRLQWLPAEFLSDVFAQSLPCVPALADAVLGDSSNALLPFLVSLLSACHDAMPPHGRPALRKLLASLCAELATRNPGKAAGELLESVLPMMASFVAADARVRAPLCAALVGSLCSTAPQFDSALTSLKETLQDETTDPSAFPSCLAELAATSSFKGACWKEALALVNPADDSTKGAPMLLVLQCLATLAPDAPCTQEGDAALMDLATAVAGDCCGGWWEAHLLCVRLACNLLQRQDRTQDTVVSQLSSIVADIAVKAESPLITFAAAEGLSSVLVLRHDKRLCLPLVRILLKLPLEVVRLAVGASSSTTLGEIFKEIAGLSCVWDARAYLVQNSEVRLPARWRDAGMVDDLVHQIGVQLSPTGPKEVALKAVEIVFQCSKVSKDVSTKGQSSKWNGVLNPLSECLHEMLVSAKERDSQVASELLETFFYCCPKEALATMPVLLASVTVLSSSEDAGARKRVRTLLKNISKASGSHLSAIKTLIATVPALPHSEEFTSALNN